VGSRAGALPYLFRNAGRVSTFQPRTYYCQRTHTELRNAVRTLIASWQAVTSSWSFEARFSARTAGIGKTAPTGFDMRHGGSRALRSVAPMMCTRTPGVRVGPTHAAGPIGMPRITASCHCVVSWGPFLLALPFPQLARRLFACERPPCPKIFISDFKIWPRELAVLSNMPGPPLAVRSAGWR
jgi:hypothetical protein